MLPWTNKIISRRSCCWHPLDGSARHPGRGWDGVGGRGKPFMCKDIYFVSLSNGKVTEKYIIMLVNSSRVERGCEERSYITERPVHLQGI